MLARSFRSRISLVALAAASTLVAFAACGDDETKPSSTSSTTSTSTSTTAGSGGGPDVPCVLPAFDEGDAKGHADPYGAKAAQEARAGVLASASQIVQPAHGRQPIEVGDYVLANDRIAVVIEKPGLSDGYARFGGEILAIDQVGDDGRPRGFSKYGETLLGIAIEMIDPTSVTVLKDGRGGGEAVVRAKGKLKKIPFLGDGAFAAFFPNPYSLEGVVDYVLAPGSDALLVRFGVNNTTEGELNFGVDRVDSDELYGFFHTSQMQIVTPEKGFADANGKAAFVGFDGGEFGFAFRDLDGPLRFGVSQSGFNLYYGNGFKAPACQRTTNDHVEVIAGGPDYDGLREAVRRHTGEAAERVVTGTLKDAEGAPIAGAYVHELGADGAYLSRVRTDADGKFAIHAPDAAVKLVPHVNGYPPHEGTAVAPDTKSVDLAFAPHAKLRVVVKSAGAGEALPVRVQMIPKAKLPATPAAFGQPDQLGDRLHQDFAITGDTTLVVPPGDHRVLVTRGYEWELFDQTVTATAGQTTEVPVELVHSVDSTGVMCGDFHIHSFMSMDSSDPIDFKVRGALADGLEIPVSSEHEWIVDFQPVIEKLGMTKWAFGVPSEELTTFTYGHFGIVPLKPKYDRVNAGALEWIGRPVGEVFADAHAQSEAPVIIVNHPRGGSLGAYFSSAAFDEEQGIGLGELWSPDFDFVEVFNDSDFEKNRNASVRDWFALLNHGRRIFAVGSSDSHHLRTSPVGYPRTCFSFGHDDPTKLTHAVVRDAMKSGNSTISGGLFMTVAGPNGEAPGGLVAGSGAIPKFTVTVQAPSFVSATTLEVIVNGITVKTEDLLPLGDGVGHRWVNEVDVPIPDGKSPAWVVFHAKGEGDLAPLHPGRKAFAVSNPVYLKP